MTLAETFRKIILANELSGNLSAALKFSDPDGVRSGKSGWSFGVCQFDINNNPAAAACLGECGFTPDEVAALKAQTIDVKPLASRLAAHADIIEKWDERQLGYCLDHAQALLKKYGIVAIDDAATLAVADFANQYGLSDVDQPGYLVHHLHGLGRRFTAFDVLSFKLHGTTYGRQHPEDCQRRYDNLMKICHGAA